MNIIINPFSNISFDEFIKKIQTLLPDSVVHTDSTGRIHIDTNYFINNENQVKSYDSIFRQQ
jgi:hypothetical protein